MLPEKPYAISCDRNSEPILAVLKEYLSNCKSLFEMGAGTGQHAVFMAPYFPNLKWYLLDQEDRHEGIRTWMTDYPRVNVVGPIEYSIGKTPWPNEEMDAVFTANTLHIISWKECLEFFTEMSKALKTNGFFLVYGAFNYNGHFTSESNKKFESWLKDRDPKSGIRDFEKVCQELETCGLKLIKDHEMPSNNRMLVFQKQ